MSDGPAPRRPQPRAPRRRPRAPSPLLLLALLLLAAAAAPAPARAQGLSKDQRPDLGAGGAYSQLRGVYSDAEQIRRMYRERAAACAQRGGAGSLCTGGTRDQLGQIISTVSTQQTPELVQAPQAQAQAQPQPQGQPQAQAQPQRALAEPPAPGTALSGRRLLLRGSR